MTDNQRGAAYMTLAMLFFLLNDSCMKALSGDMPLSQALMIRGAGTVAILIPWGLLRGGLRLQLPRRDWGLIGLRTLGEIGAAWFFITAYFHMPIGNANAILQALPLAVTLAAALFLGEPVGWRRLCAIVVGFLGVLLIVRPGGDGFNFYSIYALISVGMVVLRDLATRRLSAAVPSLLVATSAGMGVGLFGLGGVLMDEWHPVSALAALKLLGAMVFVLLGYIASIKTMRVGDIGFVSPFRYTGLVFALIAGYLLFGEVPDAITLLGAAIVSATGIFTLLRERRLAHPAGPVPLRIR